MLSDIENDNKFREILNQSFSIEQNLSSFFIERNTNFPNNWNKPQNKLKIRFNSNICSKFTSFNVNVLEVPLTRYYFQFYIKLIELMYS